MPRVGDGKDEVAVLEGDIDTLEPYMELDARQTIRLEGVGEALTGLYYVTEVDFELSGTEFKQSLKVERNGFGDYTKAYDVAIKGKKTVQSDAVKPVTKNKTHKVKKGDTLYSISKKYYGSSKYADKIYKANKSKIKSKNILKVGIVLILP
ncbi:MAG: LysM peptidoglycan-binding domain-containing protein [Clostridia bacterium]